MSARFSLCLILLLLQALLAASPAAAGRKSKGHGNAKHGGGHGHHGPRTLVSFGPNGFNVGVIGNHFGVEFGVPWQAAPIYGNRPPITYYPNARYGIGPLHGQPLSAS